MQRSKVKVAHISSVHKPRDVRIFEKQCKTLAKNGYDVHLLVPDDNGWEEDEVKVHAVRKSANRIIRMTITVHKLYRLALKVNAGIYHFHDPELIPLGILLRLRGKIVIRDIHEDHPKQMLSKKWIAPVFRSIISLFIKSLEKLSSRFFNAIITVTPSINKRFSDLESVVIQNYPQFELNQPVTNKEISGDPYMTFVGGITSIRGIMEMLDALEIVNNSNSGKKLRFILVGSFETSALENDAKNHEGWKYTEFKGWLDRNQVNRIMESALAGLVLYHPVPNHVDAQPNKLFEYMSNGLPIVASDFPLWREIIDSDQCGLLANPLEPKEIADQILYILDNPEEARVMGENGRRAVIEKYNWESESVKLVNLYEKLSKKYKNKLK
ncbi:MAG: glycosyltransferase family 4 protein [Cyclobacteriaceae bacterium]